MELFEAIERFRNSGKKVVAFTQEILMSGGYYAVAPANKIIATRGALVGSIGVIMFNVNLKNTFEKFGINFNVFKSAEYKDILSPYRNIKDNEKEFLQKLVNENHETFVNDIIKWRGTNHSETIKSAANGLFYTSKMAKSHGLIDKIGNFNTAKQEIASLVNVQNPTELHFIDINKKLNWVNNFFEILQSNNNLINWKNPFFSFLNFF